MSTMSVVLVAMLAAAVSPMAQAERLESKVYDDLKASKGAPRDATVNAKSDIYRAAIANCGETDPRGLDLDARIFWAETTADCLKKAEAALRFAATAPDIEQDVRMSHLYEADTSGVAAGTLTEAVKVGSGEKEFIGLQWGIGIGISHGFHEAVDDAAVVNGVVRVNRDNSTRPRLILEFHRFFNHPDPAMGKSITHGNGPFVAVAASEDDALSAVGAGWMWGWKDSTLPTDANAFTLGVGVVVDLNVKTLGDGIRANQPLPEGETEVRFKEKSRPSLMLVFTRTFN